MRALRRTPPHPRIRRDTGAAATRGVGPRVAPIVVLAAVLGFAPAPASASIEEASRHYEKALTEFEGGRLDAAVIALKAALREDPGLLPAHVLVGRIYLAVGEAAAAEEALRKARRLGADPNIVWPLRAEALLRQFKFKELLALSPEDGLNTQAQSEVLVTRGKAHMELGEYAEAEASFSAAAAMTPAAPQPQVALAVAALRQGDVYAAEARAIRATRIAPESADAWNVRGDVANAMGKLDEALEAYGLALERDAGHFDALLARAGVLLDRGRYDEAATDVGRLRERAPLDPRGAYLESVLYAKQGRRGEAREALRRAAALLDEMGTAAVARNMQFVLLAGLANYELGELEQAQGQLARYVERYPGQPGPRKLLGAILLAKKRTAEAILALEPALDKAPNDYRLLSLLGAAYMQKGRHDIATGYLEKAVDLSRGAPRVRARLALSRIGAGFERRGLDELEAVYRDSPQERQAIGLTLATLLLKAGRFDEAAAVAGQLRDFQPRNLTALNLHGSALLGAGRRDEARAAFGEALTVDPDFLPAKINLARLDTDAGDLEAARSTYLQIVEQRPDSVRAMVGLARVEQRLGRAADAARWLQKAQATDPSSVPTALALVDLYIDIEEPAEAQRIAREAEDRHPEDLDVLAALARAYLAQQRPELAAEVYRRMARIAGFEADELLRIARLQVAIGAEKEAIYSLGKGLRGDPEHLGTRLLLFELELRDGRVAEALEGAEALRAERPDLAAAHRIAGDAQAASGHVDVALERYRRALELEPDARHALRVYGARRAAGDAGAALAFLEGWLREHPDDGAVLRALAESHLAAGRLEPARAYYERALAADPRDAGVLNNLANILDRLGDERALEYAERALRLRPDDPAVLDTVGWMLVRRGEVSRGLSRLRDAHSRAAGDPEIRYHIASALVALDRPDEARRELRRALASARPFDGIDDARALLERLGAR